MLWDSKELFEKIFTSQLDAILLLDAGSPPKIVEANPSATEMFGYTRSEMLGRTTAFLHASQETLKKFQENLYPAIEEDGFYHLPDFEMKRKDGTIFPTEHSVIPLKGNQGERVGWLSVVRDVTERKRAEEAFKKSEAQYRELVQNANSAIVRWKVDGTVTFFNEYAQNFFGYEEDEIIGKDVRILVPEEDSSGEDLSGLVQDIVGNPERFVNNINENVRRDGRRVWMAWTNKPVLDENGQALQILAVGTDITERRRTEDKLRASEERLHRLFEEDLTGNFVCTAEGNIVICNRAYASIFGYPSSREAVGTSMLELYGDRAERHSMLESLKRQGKLEGYEAWRRRIDGTPIHVVENLVAHFNDRGELSEIQGYIFDDTDRKRAEAALQKAHDELESRVKERTNELEELAEKLRFLSARLLETQESERRSLALELHDGLGGSLLAIKMAVEQKLRDIQKGRPASEGTTLEQILDLVRNCMRDSSMLQHNLRPSVLDHLGIAPALRSLCREFENAHRGIRTVYSLAIEEVDVPEELKIILYRISQEALTNVAKHSEAENVNLFLTNYQGKVQLVVQDDGRGFDVEKALRPDRLRRGIGLASMKERCELWRGTFSVDSKEGEGTTIHCSWPSGL